MMGPRCWITALCLLGMAVRADGQAPDCTITVDAAVWAGSTGNLASVPDAGAGATYVWQLSSGVIAGGQGTRQLTFVAGGPGMLTMDVAITAGNGLMCTDSAAVAVQASLILNEYNAVGGDKLLEDGGEDAHWGRVAGNGGDWFELVVIADHLDLRHWQLGIHDASGGPDMQLDLTAHEVWADLRSGTILTVSEDLGNNADAYRPAVGGWWLNVKAADDTDGAYLTAANFRVNNDDWQLTIRNALGVIAFGPAGEGVRPTGGVGSQEICKLEAQPSPVITPLSNYQPGDSSTFGSPNAWNGGVDVQDFSTLRGVLPYSPLTSVRINEVFSHTDLPEIDWIELHNTTMSPIDVGGWRLSDDVGTLDAYSIPPGVTIPAGGYLVFYETQLGFALDSAHGDEVYLSVADANGVLTGARDHVAFGAAANGMSLGRFPNGVGRLYPLQAPTPAAENAPPVIGPVVINEIMYHPPDIGTPGVDNVDHEFVELHNVTDGPVGLSTYFPAVNQTHPWALRGGVTFEFAPGDVITPYGHVLVVSFDPSADLVRLAAFRAVYGLDAATPIFGPYQGKLSNAGETLGLYRPDTPQPPGAPDAGFVPQLILEEVPYTDHLPWPPTADGAGLSLERILPDAVADLPPHWRASSVAGGTPGAVNSCPSPGDQDNDGVVDLEDFQRLLNCLTGSGVGWAAPRCICFDQDSDADVDLRDVAAFTRVFGLPGA